MSYWQLWRPPLVTFIKKHVLVGKTLSWLSCRKYFSSLSTTANHDNLNETNNSSVTRAAEEYMQCLIELAKLPKTLVSFHEQNKLTMDSRELRIRGKQAWLHAELKEFLQSVTMETQKYHKKKKKLCYAIIDKLGWTFADTLLSLNWQERRNITALILADFPVNNALKERNGQDYILQNTREDRVESLVTDSLQAGWSDDIASFREPLEETSTDWEPLLYNDIHFSTRKGLKDTSLRTFDRDWQFYDIFLSGMASHPTGLEVACEWRRTLHDLCLPVNAVGVVDYFSNQSMDTKAIIQSAQMCLNFLMRHIEIYFRQCFLCIETVDVANMNAFTRSYKSCLLRASVLPSIPEGDFLKRIQRPGRKVFVLVHQSALNYPLAFAELALTRQLPNTLEQVEELELNWSDLESGSLEDPFFVVLLECFPTGRTSKMGLTKTLIDMLLLKLKRQYSMSIKSIYTLSHIRGLLPWMKKQVERHKAIATNESSSLLKSAADVLSQVFLANGKPKSIDQLNRQLLEENKQALLAICAHYLIRVRRNGGLPADSCTALHLTNGARLTDICWYSDNSTSSVGHSALMMSRFCYHLDSKQYYAYYFASRNFVNTSDKVQYWLNQFKVWSTTDEFDNRI
ncbi:hypothetical protein GpartN1_g7737.t1 [Galdieria partita]|uniref:Malonyl-CoA decarboxylase C-terminal domain-containing protein n=1 Tax=Galdieria partita TaxID=83374 RepID=A0A9C7Q752_9RHOD|nr:hypothetical protein GpartN1_g7737.t1 [Galdieria partita]